MYFFIIVLRVLRAQDLRGTYMFGFQLNFFVTGFDKLAERETTNV